MKKIAVFTGTRAEYGLLYLVLKALQKSDQVALQLYVGGTHLSKKYGYTISHILDDGFDVTEMIEYPIDSNSPTDTSVSMAHAQIGVSKAIEKHKPDVLILLGDRYEALAAASSATIAGVQVAHIHGGEITEGAIDDCFRHAITKMSHIHFTSTEQYRQRVIQLGEHPKTVFNVGAPGIDNIMRLPLLSQFEVDNFLNLKANEAFFLITFHSETVGGVDSVGSLRQLFAALDSFPQYKLIITYPNADTYGSALIEEMKAYQASNPERVSLYESIGQLKYLSAMKYCTAVIGNSSSGIIETPSFHKPTVNIGHRQKGRLAASSVIHCNDDSKSITEAIEMAVSQDFVANLPNVHNPYGKGNASEEIVKQLLVFNGEKVGKSFYDLPVLGDIPNDE